MQTRFPHGLIVTNNYVRKNLKSQRVFGNIDRQVRLLFVKIEYGGRRVTGVPPGLQNQCWAFVASWVGSIPTCLRQKVDLQETGILQILYN